MLRAKRSTHRQPRHLGVRRARYIIPEESLLRPGVNKCRRLSGVCWIRAIERPPELVAKARLGVAEGRARRALPRLPHNAERRSTAGRRRREQKRREYSFPSRSLQHSADHRLRGYDRRKAADRQPDLRPDRHAPQPHTGAEHLRLNASVSGALRGTEGSNPSPSTGEMVWGRRRGDGTIVAASN